MPRDPWDFEPPRYISREPGESLASYSARVVEQHRLRIEAQKSRYYNRVPTPNESEDDADADLDDDGYSDDDDDDDDDDDARDNTPEKPSKLRACDIMGMDPHDPDLIYFGVEPEPRPQPSYPSPRTLRRQLIEDMRSFNDPLPLALADELSAEDNDEDNYDESNPKPISVLTAERRYWAQVEAEKAEAEAQRQMRYWAQVEAEGRTAEAKAQQAEVLDQIRAQRERERAQVQLAEMRVRAECERERAEVEAQYAEMREQARIAREREWAQAQSSMADKEAGSWNQKRKRESRDHESSRNSKKRKTTPVAAAAATSRVNPPSAPLRRSARSSGGDADAKPTGGKRSREPEEDAGVDQCKRRKTMSTEALLSPPDSYYSHHIRTGNASLPPTKSKRSREPDKGECPEAKRRKTTTTTRTPPPSSRATRQARPRLPPIRMPRSQKEQQKQEQQEQKEQQQPQHDDSPVQPSPAPAQATATTPARRQTRSARPAVLFELDSRGKALPQDSKVSRAARKHEPDTERTDLDDDNESIPPPPRAKPTTSRQRAATGAGVKKTSKAPRSRSSRAKQ